MRVRTHTNPFNFYQKMTPIDFEAAFPNFSGSYDLEIGFGRGKFLRYWSKKHPERAIIGVEIRQPLVQSLKEQLEEDNVTNALPIYGSGERFLSDLAPDASIDRVFLFHPDPWLKKRYQKRRVINPAMLDQLAKKMKPKGLFFVSTDVAVLYEDMVAQLQAHAQFDVQHNHPFFQQDYHTHWQAFSERDSRESFSACFLRCMPHS